MVRRLVVDRGGGRLKLRRLAMGGGVGVGSGGGAGLSLVLSTPSRNTPPLKMPQGGSLPHLFVLVHHKAARSGSKW